MYAKIHYQFKVLCVSLCHSYNKFPGNIILDRKKHGNIFIIIYLTCLKFLLVSSKVLFRNVSKYLLWVIKALSSVISELVISLQNNVVHIRIMSEIWFEIEHVLLLWVIQFILGTLFLPVYIQDSQQYICILHHSSVEFFYQWTSYFNTEQCSTGKYYVWTYGLEIEHVLPLLACSQDIYYDLEHKDWHAKLNFQQQPWYIKLRRVRKAWNFCIKKENNVGICFNIIIIYNLYYLKWTKTK